MFLRAVILSLACLATVTAQNPEPAKPSVEKIDATRFRIGQVTFDSRTREIRFPASINMNKDLLEFLIVHKNGKVHESLLKTDISPTDLNIAFSLLRYKPSPELYAEPSSPDDPSGKFPAVPEDVKNASRVTIEVEWDDAGTIRKVPLNEWVQHASTGSAMPAGPWVYGGSEITENGFAAERTGDIAAIFLSRAALLNYPGKDNQDDTVWFVYPKRVPALDFPVTVIISPYKP